MPTRILAALQRLRQDLATTLDRRAVEDACHAQQYSWRCRTLDPFTTVQLLILQVLHKNAALAHLPHIAGLSFSASAFCQARARLPLAVLVDLLRRVGQALRTDTQLVGRWLGHRTFLVDGSAFSMPDTPELQAHFGQSKKAKPGCGFPVAHLMALFHAGTGVLLEAFAAPLRSGDLGPVGRLHPALAPGDVLVGDRGFCSFAHLAVLRGRELHAVVRLHQRQIVDFTPGRSHTPVRGAGRAAVGVPRSRWVRTIGPEDQVVAWLKPATLPWWMSREEYALLPEEIVLRELRYRTHRVGFRTRVVTLLTTLVDETTYDAAALAGLYKQRWEVETHLRELKQTMGLDVLKCRTVVGVAKELAVFALVYNLVRAVIVEAARDRGLPVSRISFVDALRWLATWREGLGRPVLVINRERPDRVEPRVIKRRPKNYPWMSKPRPELRKAILERGKALT